jgi:fructokinase
MTRVFCLGEVLYDCIAEQIGLPLAEVQSWQRYPGGAPANVACALAKLGTPAAFVGAVGDDADGGALVRMLETCGVDCSGVEVAKGRPTRNVLVLRDGAGDRSFAAFRDGIGTQKFADGFLSAGLVETLAMEDGTYGVLGTIPFAYPQSQQAAQSWINRLKAQGGWVVLDVNWRSVFWDSEERGRRAVLDAINQAQILKLSDDEAEWLFGYRDLAAIPGQVAVQFPHLTGILLSAGGQGCGYWWRGLKGEVYSGWVPGFEVVVVDTTGAGDAFLAGAIHYLCHHGAIDSANDALAMVRYGCAMGALTTMKAGAIEAQPLPAAVQALLDKQPQRG